MLSDIGNANWAGRAFSLFGWYIEIRIRRNGRRQRHREWLKINVFSYNYSDEAKNADLEPTTQSRCYNCGQDWEGDSDG